MHLVDESLHNKDSSSWLKNKFHAHSDAYNFQNTYSLWNTPCVSSQMWRNTPGIIIFCLEMNAKTTSILFHFFSDDCLNKRTIARWNFFSDNLNFSTALRIVNQVGFHFDGVFMALNYYLHYGWTLDFQHELAVFDYHVHNCTKLVFIG